MRRYHARWVLPITAPPVADGCVAVDDAGRIAYVGPRDGAPAGEDRDLGDALLLPGLVNAHCHLELTGMRGFLEGLGFREWILRLTTAKRAVLGREDLLDAARLGVAEGLRAGITAYADTCDSGVAFDAMLEAGVRGVMYQEVFGPDPAQCERSMAELRAKVDALRPRETALVRVGISPHAPYTVSDALFAAAAAYSSEAALPMAIHIAESELESALVERGDGDFADGLRQRGIEVAPRAVSPVQLLERLEVLARARPLLIHGVRLRDGDVQAVARHACAVAHCPASNAKLGHGIAPLRELLDAGIVVGLGSDSVASNNRMAILEEARLAALFQSARLGRPDVVPAEEALALATIGGARAIGIDDRVGSLEPGKDADLAAFSLGGIHAAAPTLDPVAAAVHALSATPASFVAVAGRVLVEDGRLVRAHAGVAERVQRAADRLGAWLADQRGSVPVPPASATR
jgi:cytosine/adenosine deaminase-related metal-dependent hydrolase